LWTKAADEFKAGKNDDLYHWARGWHYGALTEAAETPKEEAELWTKAADEFKAGKNDDLYHWAMGWHYGALTKAAETPKEKAEAMGWHYGALTKAAETPKEKAELWTKAADEFKAGKNDDLYLLAMGWHYGALTEAAETPKEEAELWTKAADEFKAGHSDDSYRRAMAWHYYLSSLVSKDKKEIEDLKLKAVNETDWLYIANIAISKSKISKKAEEIISFVNDAISSYEKYLDKKGKKFPKFPIFIDGNLRDEKIVKGVSEKIGEYFITKVSPFLENKPIEVEELDNMIEKNDFILILVETNVDERLSFEMGLAYTAGKPVVLLVSGDISNINPIFSKAATITQKLDYAITVLRLFSIIKSGEILEVDKEERERMAGFLKSIERIEIPQPKIEFPSYIEEKERMADFLKPMEGIEILEPKIELKSSLIEEEMPLKQKQGRLGGDKV
jgi:hypothetical protein